MEKSTKYCVRCGAEFDSRAEFCSKCGVRVNSVQANSYREMKSPGIAVVLSFFIPGLGQLYNGQIGKGIVVMIVSFIFAASMILIIGFILYPLLWLWNLYDAYTTANRINQGIA